MREGDGYLDPDELWTSRCNLMRDFLSLMDIDPHLMLVVFLPALLFESACFGIDMGIFRKQIAQICLMAFPAMVLASFITALCLYALAPSTWTIWVCWLIGIIASATDPVAVVALLKELGAAKTLGTLIEGESLLNDGSAVVLYAFLMSWITYDPAELPSDANITEGLGTDPPGEWNGYFPVTLYPWAEALLLVAPDVASTALSTRTPTPCRSFSGDVIAGSTSLGDGALQRLADDALDDSTAESVRAQHYAVLTRCCAHSPEFFAQALGEDRALGVYRAWLARKHVRGDSQTFDDGEARKGADVDGISGDVLAARASTGALACLRLASLGDGQALLADLDGALTLVNEAVRRGPGWQPASTDPRSQRRSSPRQAAASLHCPLCRISHHSIVSFSAAAAVDSLPPAAQRPAEVGAGCAPSRRLPRGRSRCPRPAAASMQLQFVAGSRCFDAAPASPRPPHPPRRPRRPRAVRTRT